MEWRLDRIVDEVRAHPAQHVVVTGGEPMIAPEIIPLTERLHALGLHITVETAGTVFQPVACDLMSISPKLANSTPDSEPPAARHERLRIQPDILMELMRRYDYQLKFVVEKPEDLEEVRALRRLLCAERERVILMPEGTDRDVLQQRGVWLAEICKEEGFRFSPRLHVELWGNKRGV
jgi:7-carboxy-7-deazaguanine synthase